MHQRLAGSMCLHVIVFIREREYHIKSVMKINGDERGREMWVPWSCGNER